MGLKMDDANDRPDDILTVADVARVLRCSKAHVCKIINGQVKGTAPIPSIAFGRRKVIRRQSLLRWMCANEQGARIESSLEIDAGRRA
jgi:Helix-turn-helix domain